MRILPLALSLGACHPERGEESASEPISVQGASHRPLTEIFPSEDTLKDVQDGGRVDGTPILTGLYCVKNEEAEDLQVPGEVGNIYLPRERSEQLDEQYRPSILAAIQDEPFLLDLAASQFTIPAEAEACSVVYLIYCSTHSGGATPIPTSWMPAAKWNIQDFSQRVGVKPTVTTTVSADGTPLAPTLNRDFERQVCDDVRQAARSTPGAL